jgi:hypothetical protein
MNKYFLYMALIYGLLLASISPTQAMTISESFLSDDVHILKLQGEIIKGDFTRVRNFIGKANRDRKRRIVVLIDSGGGLVDEGWAIANFVFDNKLPVAVHRDCESSCFMIFAAGSVKLVGPDSHIGVHSVNMRGVGENPDAKAGTVEMGRELLDHYGVPASVIGQLVTHGPHQMYYLTNADLTAMGANIAK